MKTYCWPAFPHAKAFLKTIISCRSSRILGMFVSRKLKWYIDGNFCTKHQKFFNYHDTMAIKIIAILSSAFRLRALLLIRAPPDEALIGEMFGLFKIKFIFERFRDRKYFLPSKVLIMLFCFNPQFLSEWQPRWFFYNKKLSAVSVIATFGPWNQSFYTIIIAKSNFLSDISKNLK